MSDNQPKIRSSIESSVSLETMKSGTTKAASLLLMNDKIMNYTVKIAQSGRGGTIYYAANDKELPFGWEFAIDGVLIFFPSAQDWKTFFDTNTLFT